MSSREHTWWRLRATYLRPGHIMAVITLGLAALTPAQADEALARAKGCMGCHAIGQKIVGPSFAAVAARYAKTPAAPAMVARNILGGWKDAWGDVPMPAQDHVSAAEADLLARWVLAQRQ